MSGRAHDERMTIQLGWNPLKGFDLLFEKEPEFRCLPEERLQLGLAALIVF